VLIMAEASVPVLESNETPRWPSKPEALSWFAGCAITFLVA
jgi:hypothetical protein